MNSKQADLLDTINNQIITDDIQLFEQFTANMLCWTMSVSTTSNTIKNIISLIGLVKGEEFLYRVLRIPFLENTNELMETVSDEEYVIIKSFYIYFVSKQEDSMAIVKLILILYKFYTPSCAINIARNLDMKSYGIIPSDSFDRLLTNLAFVIYFKNSNWFNEYFEIIEKYTDKESVVNILFKNVQVPYSSDEEFIPLYDTVDPTKEELFNKLVELGNKIKTTDDNTSVISTLKLGLNTLYPVHIVSSILDE